MHPSVANHPEWQARQAEMAEAERARRTALTAGAEWEAECGRLKAEYDTAMEEAIGSATPPPPSPLYPPRPDAGEMLHRVTARRDRLKAEEKAWLADHADDLLAVLSRDEERVVRDVRPIVAMLDAPVRELAEIAGTAARLRQARGDRVVSPERVDAPTVVAAVTAGTRWVPKPEPATARHPAEVVQLAGRTSGEQVDAASAARRERSGMRPSGRPWARR